MAKLRPRSGGFEIRGLPGRRSGGYRGTTMASFSDDEAHRVPSPAPAVRLAGLALWLGRGTLDLLFPPACLSCRRSIAGGGALCGAC